MSKFRKKPVVIEAEQYVPAGTIKSQWAIDAINSGKIVQVSDGCFINTLEGKMQVSPNDWIIRGVAGEIYPCKPDIFDATYEAVE